MSDLCSNLSLPSYYKGSSCSYCKRMMSKHSRCMCRKRVMLKSSFSLCILSTHWLWSISCFWLRQSQRRAGCPCQYLGTVRESWRVSPQRWNLLFLRVPYSPVRWLSLWYEELYSVVGFLKELKSSMHTENSLTWYNAILSLEDMRTPGDAIILVQGPASKYRRIREMVVEISFKFIIFNSSYILLGSGSLNSKMTLDAGPRSLRTPHLMERWW